MCVGDDQTRSANIEPRNSQPFSWKAAVLFIATAGGLVWYFEYEKNRMQKKRIAEANKSVGKPKVGGSFHMVDQDGKPFTEADLKGRFSLVRHWKHGKCRVVGNLQTPSVSYS